MATCKKCGSEQAVKRGIVANKQRYRRTECGSTGNTVAWVLGGRDTATFRRLYDKVKHLKDCTFYTDHGEAFTNIFPPERHIIGKAHTSAIERDNSNTRHHLVRFTRSTKVVSRLELMVNSFCVFGTPLRLRPNSLCCKILRSSFRARLR